MKKGNSSISKKFLLFFILSIVFWFLTKLSKEYESTIQFPISYDNLPQNKLIQSKETKEIGVHVKASGFKIISGKLFPKTIALDASNLSLKSGTLYFLLLSQQRLAIQKQMNTGVEIDHFIQDSIVLDLGLLDQKRVPVQFESSLSYLTGYDINGPIEIVPDSVLVSGPESILDTINFIRTRRFVKKDINTSFKETLTLQTYDQSANLRYEVDQVSVKANVEKFTEGNQTIAFRIINFPDDLQINTFPKEVKLTYKVALSDFNLINASSFVVECDYQLSSENNLTYLVPRVTKQPNRVKNVKLSPSKIDFVIEK